MYFGFGVGVGVASASAAKNRATIGLFYTQHEKSMFDKKIVNQRSISILLTTDLGYKVDPRLRELAFHGHRDPGGGIHAT